MWHTLSLGLFEQHRKSARVSTSVLLAQPWSLQPSSINPFDVSLSIFRLECQPPTTQFVTQGDFNPLQIRSMMAAACTAYFTSFVGSVVPPYHVPPPSVRVRSKTSCPHSTSLLSISAMLFHTRGVIYTTTQNYETSGNTQGTADQRTGVLVRLLVR